MQTETARLRALPPTPSGNNRRRNARVAAPAGLRATLVDQGLNLAVRDISVGGLSARTEGHLAPNSVHVVSLKLGGVSILSRVRTVHCRPEQGAWLVGFAFVGEGSRSGAAIATLMDAVLSSTIEFW